MRISALLLVVAVSSTCMAQVYKFGEPKGTRIDSSENHKPSPDGFRGVRPIVVIGKTDMTIVWGDATSAGGSERSWTATIFHRDSSSVSAVSIDDGTFGSAVMLYTVNTKRGVLYMSTHKESDLMNGSSAASFVALLEK